MSSLPLRASLLCLAAALPACAPRVALEPMPVVQSQGWTGTGPPAAAQAMSGERGGSLGLALGSPELEALIARAMANNADVAVAAARIRQSRALLRIARGAMLPTVSGSAGLSGTRTERTGDPFDFSDGFGQLDISFELDLFGARRAERNAALNRFRATEYDRHAVALAIQADVARAFVQRAALSARIEFINRNIDQARELERIIRARVDAGETTRVDLGLQTIQVRQLETERSRLEEALARTRTSLAVLVGEEAPRFAQAPAALTALAPPAIELVQPAELITRRPDIQASEARIHAAGGDVRAARAAFFPRLRLSARALGQAASLSGPLGSTFSLGADLLAPIFDRGRLRGNLEFAGGQQAESVALYRLVLLTALAEVENAMSAVDRAEERVALTAEMVAQARDTARLARLQYLEGDTDLQRLFDAEQRLVENEDARLIALHERIEAAIDLFKALGGTPARL